MPSNKETSSTLDQLKQVEYFHVSHSTVACIMFAGYSRRAHAYERLLFKPLKLRTPLCSGGPRRCVDCELPPEFDSREWVISFAVCNKA